MTMDSLVYMTGGLSLVMGRIIPDGRRTLYGLLYANWFIERTQFTGPLHSNAAAKL